MTTNYTNICLGNLAGKQVKAIGALGMGKNLLPSPYPQSPVPSPLVTKFCYNQNALGGDLRM